MLLLIAVLQTCEGLTGRLPERFLVTDGFDGCLTGEYHNVLCDPTLKSKVIAKWVRPYDRSKSKIINAISIKVSRRDADTWKWTLDDQSSDFDMDITVEPSGIIKGRDFQERTESEDEKPVSERAIQNLGKTAVPA